MEDRYKTITIPLCDGRGMVLYTFTYNAIHQGVLGRIQGDLSRMNLITYVYDVHIGRMPGYSCAPKKVVRDDPATTDLLEWLELEVRQVCDWFFTQSPENQQEREDRAIVAHARLTRIFKRFCRMSPDAENSIYEINP